MSIKEQMSCQFCGHVGRVYCNHFRSTVVNGHTKKWSFPNRRCLGKFEPLRLHEHVMANCNKLTHRSASGQTSATVCEITGRVVVGQVSVSVKVSECTSASEWQKKGERVLHMSSADMALGHTHCPVGLTERMQWGLSRKEGSSVSSNALMCSEQIKKHRPAIKSCATNGKNKLANINRSQCAQKTGPTLNTATEERNGRMSSHLPTQLALDSLAIAIDLPSHVIRCSSLLLTKRHQSYRERASACP